MKFAKLMMAAVAAAGTLFVLTGCGESPSQAFQKCMQGFKNGDLQTVNKYSVHQFESLPEGNIIEKKATITVEKEEINGDTAVVHAVATYQTPDGKQRQDKAQFTMRKVDGVWKVEGR